MSAGRDEIAAMVADVFADLAAAAVLTPAGGGEAISLRVAPRMIDVDALDDIGMPTLQRARVFSVLTSSAHDRPGKGATIQILPGSDAQPGTYPVLEEAMCTDRYQLVWLCRVGEPT